MLRRVRPYTIGKCPTLTEHLDRTPNAIGQRWRSLTPKEEPRAYHRWTDADDKLLLEAYTPSPRPPPAQGEIGTEKSPSCSERPSLPSATAINSYVAPGLDGTSGNLAGRGGVGVVLDQQFGLSLRRFQHDSRRGALAPGVDTAALSIPRGNGNHTSQHPLRRELPPGDSLHQPGAQYLLSAASIEQSRLTYRPIPGVVGVAVEGDRFINSAQRVGITHKPSETRLRILSSSGKRAIGVVGVPLWVMDQPGSFQTVGGGADVRCGGRPCGEAGA